jgi:hypothetical protein
LTNVPLKVPESTSSQAIPSMGAPDVLEGLDAAGERVAAVAAGEARSSAWTRPTRQPLRTTSQSLPRPIRQGSCAMGTVRVGAPACSIIRAHWLVIIVFDMGFNLGSTSVSHCVAYSTIRKRSRFTR